MQRLRGRRVRGRSVTSSGHLVSSILPEPHAARATRGDCGQASTGGWLVPGLPFPRIRETLNLLAGEGSPYYAIQKVIDEDDTWLATFSSESLYVIVQAAIAAPELDRSLIDVHAGGAYAMHASGELFEAISIATWRFDYGGPWARVRADGATFGWRSRLPSEMFCEANVSDAFGFVLGMVDAFGMAAGTLAEELIPRFGGKPSRSDDPQAWPALMSGLLPPQ